MNKSSTNQSGGKIDSLKNSKETKMGDPTLLTVFLKAGKTDYNRKTK